MSVAASAARMSVFRWVSAAVLLVATNATAGTVTVPGSYPTIQAAINGAPSGSVIQIQPGHYHERLNLTSIRRTITLRGDPANPASVIVDGDGGGDTVRMRDCGANVVVDGITVTGGRGGNGGYGGGLFVADATAVFRHCVFTGNQADIDGGGAFVLTSGVIFADCTFQSNGAARFGGGVHVIGGTPIFERVTFTDNEAGLHDLVNGWGGGLYVTDSSPFLIGCSIRANRAHFAAGGIAIMGHGTAPRSVVTVRDTSITDNVVVPAGAGTEAQGGGMHIEDNVHAVLERVRVAGNVANSGGGLSTYRAEYEIVDSVIENNQGNAIVPDQLGGFGGGLWAGSVNSAGSVRSAASVALTRTVVRGNTAHVGAGLFVQGDFSGVTNEQATLALTDALVTGNAATGRGGGIMVDRTMATISRGLFLQNTADSWGGALAMVASSTTTIDQTTLAGNAAGVIGGALFADQGGTLTVTGARFFGNTAGTGAGVGGGAVAVMGAAGPTPGPVTGSITGSVLADDGTKYEVWEADCDASHFSAITYTGNSLHNTSGIYYRNCTGGTATVAAFNGLAGKASGNVSAAASFATFAAAPRTIVPGAIAVLAWCAPGNGGLTIDGGVGALPGTFGTAEVSPPTTSIYTLSGGATSLAQATVTVTCATLGTPIPVSPRNADTDQPPGTVTLGWYPADGAATYDVYLDAGTEPATRVATDVTAATYDVSVLPDTQYSWRAVAKSPACTEPSAGPVASFHTCRASGCDFVYTFDDGDISGWTRAGKGMAVVADGGLHIRSKRRFKVAPPAPAIHDGSVSVQVTLESGRRALRVLFGYRDAANYRELLINGASGRWLLREHARGRIRRSKLATHGMPAAGSFELRIELQGRTVTVFANDAQVLSTSLRDPNGGTLAFQVTGSAVLIDNLRISGS